MTMPTTTLRKKKKNSEELGAVEKRVLEPTEGGANTDLFVKQGFRYAIRRSLRSPYLLTNLVYVLYTSLIISIDVNEEIFELDLINRMYLGAACVHLVNATMYIWVWHHEGFPLLSVIVIPEILNMIEAALYITSATMYPSEYSEYTNATGDIIDITNQNDINNVQNIELTASLIDWLASFGWVCTWYLTYRRTLGRGFTLDDPDIWANLTIWAGTLAYVVYNCQIINDRSLYGTNDLYVTADWIFFVNSLMYFICSLRDAGWFYFMPIAGVLNFNDAYSVVKNGKAKKA